MSDKNNKNTLHTSMNRHDVIVKNNNGCIAVIEAKSHNEKVITAFVTNFYEKHGKVMSKLAYE